MQPRYAHAAALLIALIGGLAHAGGLADFNAAVEKAAVHNRVALGYLRTGNLDLAARELEFLGVAWRAVVDRFGVTPPEAFAGNGLYAPTLVDVSTRIVTANILIDLGRGDAARGSLAAIRMGLARLRAESGVPVLADCVLAANGAMDALFVFRDKPPAWTDAAARGRCDGAAPELVRGDPQFRRLIDGALAALALVPKAIEARDGDLLHRILIELRSFDHLLAFRFG
jgi:hypothetical protein